MSTLSPLLDPRRHWCDIGITDRISVITSSQLASYIKIRVKEEGIDCLGSKIQSQILDCLYW